MKFLAISCILFLALAAPFAAAEEKGLNFIQKAATLVWRAECRFKLGVSLAEQQAIHDGKFDNLNQAQKCFIMCVNQKAGFFDKNGNGNEQKVQEELSKLIGTERANFVINSCKNEVGVDKCDTAAKIFACHYGHKAVFLI